jgi:gamma-glutamylcyclotransferase (GGCT)/AIG2-like uncharacterized protein YtfP
MENNLTKLFVYGSLRSGFQNPAYDYISKYFTLIGEAKVKGRLYDMGSFPAAVPAEDDAYIVGELYEHNKASNFSWAIEQLDAYEGVNPEEGEPMLYRRDVVTVYQNGKTTDAWIYWFAGPIDDQPLIPSGDIFDFIHQKSKF